MFGKVVEYLMFLVLGISLMAYASAYTTYDLANDTYGEFDFDSSLETNTLELKQFSSTNINLYVNLDSKEYIDFKIETFDFYNLRANVQNNFTSKTSFSVPLEIDVSNAPTGDYKILVKVTGHSNTKTITKDVILSIRVIDGYRGVFNTTPYTNTLPSISAISISKRNILAEKNIPQTLTIDIKNTGSRTSFYVKSYPEVDGLKLDTDKGTYSIGLNETKKIMLSVLTDENFIENYNSTNLILVDTLTGIEQDLGKINIINAKAEYNFREVNDENSIRLLIENVGNIPGELKIESKTINEGLYLMPNENVVLNLPKEEIKIKENDKVILLVEANANLKEEDENTNFNIAGLFSLAQSQNTIYFVLIIVAISIVYFIFFKKGGVLNNNISIKELDIKE